ncbi:hypothetical protein RHMOL_Rhmol06G0147300 [Rhododendron molle]|uniref:Uncharacterized protein n=1 Tax=Rhododendron molle TaxID=49168 RepID=A0ACC0NCB0_RHOML|nr:hypothetical protein RHMOL_Rhmol06G0147300 [Rhododendron molle]
MEEVSLICSAITFWEDRVDEQYANADLGPLTLNAFDLFILFQGLNLSSLLDLWQVKIFLLVLKIVKSLRFSTELAASLTDYLLIYSFSYSSVLLSYHKIGRAFHSFVAVAGEAGTCKSSPKFKLLVRREFLFPPFISLVP